MKRDVMTFVVCVSLLLSVSPVFAAVPSVNTFSVAATAVSPVPVTAFTASDSDGTVVGYMITQTSTKPAASDSRWTTIPWAQFTTTSIGGLTLYAWAKDNAGGVSNSRNAATNVIGTHVHSMAQVTGLTTALAGKADIAHNHDSVYQKKYANVVVVAKSGADFTDPAAAMNSITDASVTNPYLVKVMPGVYDIGSASVMMKPYVDLEGSGQAITTIQGESQSGAYNTVVCASNTGLRDITVVGKGGGQSGYGTAIYLNNANPVYISRVVASASHYNNIPGGTAIIAINCESNSTVFINDATVRVESNFQSVYGIVINGTATLENVTVTVEGGSAIFSIGNTTLKNVTASASGTGIFARALLPTRSSMIMDAVNVTGAPGVSIYLATDAKIDHSSITGDFMIDASSNVFVGETKIAGQITVGDSFLKCIGVYDANYDPVNCP